MAAKRKAPSGTYWRRDTLWGRLKVGGREIRWTLRTGDVEIARSRYEARRQREVAAHHYGDERKTWEDAVVAWADHIIHEVGPNTIKRYQVSLRQVEGHFAGCYLDEIDKPLLKSLILDRRKQGASTATVRRDLVAVSSVLGYCEDEEWIETNPVLPRLKRLKERREPIVMPDPAHIAFVISRAPGLLAAMIDVAAKTGCRQEELRTLQRSGLDFGRRQITVIGKGRKTRTIDMLDAYEQLRQAAAHMRSRHVFWHSDGRPYLNVASRFAAVVKGTHIAARKEGREFRPFRFHDLRHFFAVNYLKNRDGGIRDLQLHLGHGSVGTTEVYLKHLTPEEVRVAHQGARVQRFGGEGAA